MANFLSINGLTDFQVTQHLTTVLNNIGFAPTWMLKSGLYTMQGITTTSVSLDQITSSPQLLNPRARGEIGNDLKKSSKASFKIDTIHYAEEISFAVDELQDQRQAGGFTLETLTSKVEREFQRVVRPSFSVTLENMMMQGIFGVVADKNGVVQYDLQDILKVNPAPAKTVNLSNSTALREVTVQAKRDMNTVLQTKGFAGSSGMPIVLCGAEFFKKTNASKEVIETQKHAQAQMLVTQNNAYSQFVHNGTIFIDFPSYELDGVHIGPKSEEAIMTTRNVSGLYKCFFAPANDLDFVNTEGLPLYVRQAPERKYNDGVDYKVEMSPLCVSSALDHVQTLKLSASA